MEYRHVPVMLDEVIEYLKPSEGEYFIDCTLGGAGYTKSIAKLLGKEGRILSFDLDPWAIENAKRILKEEKLENVIIENINFKNIYETAEKNFKKNNKKEFDKGIFSGIVFDLGLSNAQLEDTKRGFSFKEDTPLDMALEGDNGRTLDLINNYSREELETYLREYGEEKFYKRIVGGIFDARKTGSIETTKQLVDIIEAAVPAFYKRQKIHFATKTFQALRIATNEELESLKIALPDSLRLLKKGGRIAVISYHSLEDRIVKKIFKSESIDCHCPSSFPVCQCGHKASIKIINKKILLPTEEEVARNPKSRSAKMRVAEKI
ncbi:16S rRNA (cytosine(1402)-N(4))-methyltransferase [Candidatus Parcubacteria bacterium]|nr:MAG: 16S rRNA (cytosine(1402)-N(4))-methyltransferase [Candidatus Parcubacteria bacterium]